MERVNLKNMDFDFDNSIKKYKNHILFEMLGKQQSSKSTMLIHKELNNRINDSDFIAWLKNEEPLKIFTNPIFFYHIVHNKENLNKIKYVFIERKEEMLKSLKLMDGGFNCENECLQEMKECLNKNLKYPPAEKMYQSELEFVKNKTSLFHTYYKKYLEYKLKQSRNKPPRKLKEYEKQWLERNIFVKQQSIERWQNTIKPILLNLLD